MENFPTSSKAIKKELSNRKNILNLLLTLGIIALLFIVLGIIAFFITRNNSLLN